MIEVVSESSLFLLGKFLDGDLTKFKQMIDSYKKESGFLIYNPYKNKLTLSEPNQHYLGLGYYDIAEFKKVDIKDLKEYIYDKSKKHLEDYSVDIFNYNKFNVLDYDKDDKQLFSDLKLENKPKRIINYIIDRYFKSNILNSTMIKYVHSRKPELLNKLIDDTLEKLSYDKIDYEELIKCLWMTENIDLEPFSSILKLINLKLKEYEFSIDDCSNEIYHYIGIYISVDKMKTHFPDVNLKRTRSLVFISDISEYSKIGTITRDSVKIITESVYKNFHNYLIELDLLNKKFNSKDTHISYVKDRFDQLIIDNELYVIPDDTYNNLDLDGVITINFTAIESINLLK